jgi:hypothetical protein
MTLPRTLAFALLAACVSLAVFLLLACGSSSKGFESSPDGSADGSKVDGGAGGDGGDGSSTAPGLGVVTFVQTADAGGTFSAGFALATAGGSKLPAGCTVVDGGACVTTSCPGAGDAGASDAAVPMAPNAGTLTVTGGPVFGATGFPLSPANDGTYLYASPHAIFATGDTLGVAGAGATVPAFSTETVVAPAPIKLTAPTPPTTASGKMTIPTTADLTVSWTGGTTGAKMYFTVNAVFTASSGGASVTCSWDAAAGTGTVPQANLTPLTAGNAEGADATWNQAAQTMFSAGTWPVTLSASFEAQAALVTFQ